MLALLCVLTALPAQGAALPPPVVEFTFDQYLTNTGTAGGTATVEAYRQEDAPLLATGPWRQCLSTSHISRFGGTVADTEPAGAALLYSDETLDSWHSFTVTFWMRVPTVERGIASRVLTKLGSWEMIVTDGVASLYVSESDGKRHYSPQRPAQDPRGQWTFVAAAVDVTSEQVATVLGTAERGLGAVARHELVMPFVVRESALQIGNYQGIRPFKGDLDNLRIYRHALTDEQIRARFDADLAARSRSPEIYGRGVVAPGARVFRLKPSAIPFSSRWQSRKQERTFELLDAYHATHLLWVYGMNADYVARVHEGRRFYQGTLNGMYGALESGEDPDAPNDTTGRAWNFDNQKFVPRHMEAWPNKWQHWRGCHNSPDFRREFWEGVDKLVEIGCDAVHVDDWEMVLAPASTGRGCFCPCCMSRLRDHLQQTRSVAELRELGVDNVESFDYREYLKTRYSISNADECFERYRTIFAEDPLASLFIDAQRQGLRDFYFQLRQHLDEISPDKYIPVSVNNQFYRRAADRRFRGYYCVDLVDFFIGEVSQSMQGANHFIHCAKLAEGFDVPQVMMSKPHVLAKAQAALATTYALGACMRVPWDAYMDNDPETRQPAPRYYGEPEDWGPFYDFVHKHAPLLDDYQAAANVAVVLNADADSFALFESLADQLARAQIQFRVFPAASQFCRLPLDADTLSEFSHLVLLSPEESFCDEDRQSLARVRESLRVRFLSPETDVLSALELAGERFLRVEGPEDVYAFLRTRPDSAVIHLVNWNARSDGTTDPLGYVTLQLLQPERWGKATRVTYAQPGQPAVDLKPETHNTMLRITVPQLNTWGIVSIEPQPAE